MSRVFEQPDAIERALTLLDAALRRRGDAHVELVVIGGAALSILGFVSRPTRDIDVLAIAGESNGVVRLSSASVMLQSIAVAVGEVADAAGLPPDWLNCGPTALLDHGLPEGLEGRLISRRYGDALTVHFADRADLIPLKVFAAADTGVGRHTEDLAALDPTCEELLEGARWARTQDPSQGFADALRALLRYMGCPESAEVLEDELAQGS
jgi:hypothetical protein